MVGSRIQPAIRRVPRPTAGPHEYAELVPQRDVLEHQVSAELPHPRAVELGLVDRARPVVASYPRVAPSDAVVFYWVPSANPDRRADALAT